MDSKTRAYKFALKIIELIDKLPRDMSTQVIAKQLLRAATSIGANIIEAKQALRGETLLIFSITD
jgi:four helix bundle protein